MPVQFERTVGMEAATGADIAQRRFVVLGANGIAQATDGADAVGVSKEAYDDSEHTAGNASRTIPVVVNQGAITEVEAGAAIPAGSKIASDAQGRAIVAAIGDAELGQSFAAVSAAGEFVEIIFTKSGRLAT